MNNGWKTLVITSVLMIIFSNFAYAEMNRIEIGPWPHDIAVNPNQNLIYVSHSGVLTRSGVWQDKNQTFLLE